MKKLFILLILLPMMVKAQVVGHVCGVKFGTSYGNAFFKLQQVYHGDATFYKEDCIYYSSKTFEGIVFDGLMFKFITKDHQKLFDGADFSVSYSEESKALETRRKLIESLGKTFKIEKVTTPEGYIEYCGGISPLNRVEYGFRIYISWANIEYPYTVHLEFGPYGFEK